MRKAAQDAWQKLCLVPRLIRFTWEASPFYSVVAIGLTVVTAAAAPVQIWVSKVLIDRVSSTVQGETAMDLAFLLPPVIWMCGVWALTFVGRGYSTELQMMLSFKSHLHAEYSIMKKASELDIAFFESPSFFDRLQYARENVHRAHNIPIMALDMIASAIGLVAMMALLSTLHPVAVIVLLATAAPQMLIRGYYSNRIWRVMMHHLPAHRMSLYLSELLGSRDAASAPPPASSAPSGCSWAFSGGSRLRCVGEGCDAGHPRSSGPSSWHYSAPLVSAPMW